MLSSSTVDWVTVAMRPGSVAARMGSHCALLSTYWCCRTVSDRSLTDWTCALQAAAAVSRTCCSTWFMGCCRGPRRGCGAAARSGRRHGHTPHHPSLEGTVVSKITVKANLLNPRLKGCMRRPGRPGPRQVCLASRYLHMPGSPHHESLCVDRSGGTDAAASARDRRGAAGRIAVRPDRLVAAGTVVPARAGLADRRARPPGR